METRSKAGRSPQQAHARCGVGWQTDIDAEHSNSVRPCGRTARPRAVLHENVRPCDAVNAHGGIFKTVRDPPQRSGVNRRHRLAFSRWIPTAHLSKIFAETPHHADASAGCPFAFGELAEDIVTLTHQPSRFRVTNFHRSCRFSLNRPPPPRARTSARPRTRRHTGHRRPDR